ncbi:GTP-binding protein [Dyella caseinilytica]|uniref:ATP/GTP-binding protein n=1 Tax=Dyella caseinilytica TaxID=1849581 RepID=A0ABX7GZ79_9GAMM|nr:ATP/GTP-binding protein [Dyella caseinilytica]QRN55635.1 ATP/GTP-binding protein [Dyella caseinilytica]GGA03299.1 GTPase [Dyella caseinilytica]
MHMPDYDRAIKLLFVGPIGAGKTTAIRTISDVPPISTDVPWTEATTGGKSTTTVAFDYSTIRLDQDDVLHVYGLPGQEHLDFMGPIIGRGALGGVLLLDASSSVLQEDCAQAIHGLKRISPSLKFVIGITKTDISPNFSMSTMRRLMQQMHLSVPIFSIDPRNRTQVTQLIRTLLLVL